MDIKKLWTDRSEYIWNGYQYNQVYPPKMRIWDYVKLGILIAVIVILVSLPPLR